MAVRIASEPVPAPMPASDSAPAWAPSQGMIFSNVRIVREAFVAIEHPADWTPAQVQAATGNRRGDIAQSARWWGSENSGEIVEVIVGEYDPDDCDQKPFDLDAEDLVAPAPIVVVEAPAPTE